MTIKERHLTIEEILQLHDEELNGKTAQDAFEHLARCCDCSVRSNALKATSEGVNDAFFNEMRRTNPGHQVARLRLASQLQRSATEPSLVLRFASRPRTLIYASVTLIALASSAFAWHRYRAHQSASAYIEERALPNPRLTPGDVTYVKLSDVCPSQDDDKDPTVPVPVQEVVFHEYGVLGASYREQFQVDYLINPQLGGTAEIRNLWPQPYQSALWNAYAKDELEDRLHEMVCQHTITLDQAQREIAKDWIHAYKKYFGTEIPISREARLEDGE